MFHDKDARYFINLLILFICRRLISYVACGVSTSQYVIPPVLSDLIAQIDSRHVEPAPEIQLVPRVSFSASKRKIPVVIYRVYYKEKLHNVNQDEIRVKCTF